MKALVFLSRLICIYVIVVYIIVGGDLFDILLGIFVVLVTMYFLWKDGVKFDD